MSGSVSLDFRDAASLDAMTLIMDSALGLAPDDGGAVASLAGGLSLAPAGQAPIGQAHGSGLRIDFAVLVAQASSV